VELVEKVYYGERLTPEERTLVEAVPEVASKLLGHIPRLDPVLQILNAMTYTDAQMLTLGDGTVGLGARILSLTLEFDSLCAQGHSAHLAIQTVRAKSHRFGESLVDKFAVLVGGDGTRSEVQQIPLRLVRPGMTIMDDLRTSKGTLLVPRGFEISESFMARLRNLGSSLLEEKIRVLVPATAVEHVELSTG
jgi:hypothetical protein